ncbi:hypothetical protein LTR50_001727 [Elasticomyces elasticus]|nr:hypothetical protein LTR50_001727 [Elasticomyces elasticus]
MAATAALPSDKPTSSPSSRRQSTIPDLPPSSDNIATGATVEPTAHERPLRQLRFRSKPDIFEYTRRGSENEDVTCDTTAAGTTSSPAPSASGKVPVPILLHRASPVPPEHASMSYRFGMFALLVAVCLPLLQSTPFFGHAAPPAIGVNGGVIKERRTPLEGELIDGELLRRDNTPTDVCTRWSHQTAIVNGTLYIYGGRATNQSGQKDHQWNNNFLSMDLSKTWQISSPSLTGLTQPSGPPPVANGYLWNSHDALYLYGGEFSDNPVTYPAPFALWEYNLHSSSWIQHNYPVTSAGANSAPDNQSIQRSAEGAGLAIPSLGRGWYFGGHEDYLTTAGWSIQVERIYLQSLLEFTFPGFTNKGVGALSNGKTAGADGVYRNITQGGLQAAAGFTNRADGLLLYVPGFAPDGLLIALGGGTSKTFTQMNVIDVYDIANSVWYKQATSGPTPQIRVNPCAVMAAAPDGSSHNVYMFGGQDLNPNAQTQYNDMWILTLPSFTWIKVDTANQSVPYARAGHTCNVWNGQMVVVGGYVGNQLSCDSPGVYVFDMSNLKWVNQFTALSPAVAGGSSPDSGSSPSATASSGASPSGAAPSATSSFSSFVSNSKTNPFNQQPAQLANGSNPGGLEGSYGYQVPAAVISVVGGGPIGGATITAPVLTATAGPLATGKAITYTVTGPNGALITQTGVPGSNTGGSGGSSGPNIAAIVAGVIAGLLFLLVLYLAFCAWVYRKQLQLYKAHVDKMSARAAAADPKIVFAPFASTEGSSKSSSDRRRDAAAVVKDSAEASTRGSALGTTGSTPAGYAPIGRRSSDRSSTEDLLAGQEPTFWGTRGVLLNPRRSLRVINRD